ncbi:MAG: LamG domain-containing protein [Phycisphaerae bacterium]|nr:LamG domain-containing protein [Phycisphaerae bacterium]
MNLGSAVNSAGADTYACISQDGLELYFNSENRPAGYGGWDIWVTRRATKDAGWGPPVNLGPTVNGPAEDAMPWVSADGLELYFMVGTYGGGSSIWVTQRKARNDPWGIPVKLGPAINSSTYQGLPCLSANGLSLFFSDAWPTGPYRPGGFGGEDIWVTIRATTDDEWGIPRNLGRPVNSSLNEDSPRLSPDGSTLYFTRGSTFYVYESWQAPIVPIVDFNGDGKVDMTDLLRLIEHWGQNEPAFDIAPPPFGDGLADAKDLEVLMSYWQQEVNDPRLVASWRLDETEGLVAADRVGENDGTLHGSPLWQPEGGKIGGALRLDGVDDYVSTAFVLDPAAKPFSVFAWVKGGAPGQVVLSQASGVNWLMAASSSGTLMTEVRQLSRQSKPLTSATGITNGAWHRVGFVWDGSNRILYVDGVEAARDAQAGLAASTGGLYIGAGSNRAPASFWKGLIDDVRIYDRAVKP